MLPYFQTSSPELSKLQTTWATQLNPLISNPLAQAVAIKNVPLTTGINTINHLLGRNQQGWIVTDNQGTATVYRSAPFNNLTLQLTASANTTISLLVF